MREKGEGMRQKGGHSIERGWPRFFLLTLSPLFSSLFPIPSRLGVGRDASFEEVQDARNYLFEVRESGKGGRERGGARARERGSGREQTGGGGAGEERPNNRALCIITSPRVTSHPSQTDVQAA